MQYIDADSVFEDHRFCEKGDGGDGSEWSKAWFFQVLGPDMQPGKDDNDDGGDLITYDNANWVETCDPNASGDLGVACQYAQIVMTGNDVDESVLPAPFMKGFHPKSKGHYAIAQYIYDQIDALPASPPIFDPPSSF